MSWSPEELANAREYLVSHFERVKLPTVAKSLPTTSLVDIEDYCCPAHTQAWRRAVRHVEAKRKLREQPADGVQGVVGGAVIGERREG